MSYCWSGTSILCVFTSLGRSRLFFVVHEICVMENGAKAIQIWKECVPIDASITKKGPGSLHCRVGDFHAPNEFGEVLAFVFLGMDRIWIVAMYREITTLGEKTRVSMWCLHRNRRIPAYSGLNPIREEITVVPIIVDT